MLIREVQDKEQVMSTSVVSHGDDEKAEREGIVEDHLLAELKDECLHNFEMDSVTTDFKIFEEIKYVCFVESIENMRSLMTYINKLFIRAQPCHIGEIDVIKISESTSIAMMKAGPVLVISYGCGAKTLLIALHEVVKLLKRAGAVNLTFLLLGSSEGIGIQRGSVVINTVVLNNARPFVPDVSTRGERTRRSCNLEENICKQMKKAADLYVENFPVYLGKVFCSHDFCEVILDENISAWDNHEKISNLKDMKAIGVINYDLVSATFAGTCNKLGLKAGIISVALIDSLKDDQIPLSVYTTRAWKNRVYYLAALYLKEKHERKM